MVTKVVQFWDFAVTWGIFGKQRNKSLTEFSYIGLIKNKKIIDI
jgi:hypothetical protein